MLFYAAIQMSGPYPSEELNPHYPVPKPFWKASHQTHVHYNSKNGTLIS